MVTAMDEVADLTYDQGLLTIVGYLSPVRC